MYRSVFISHSEADKPFVRRLADDLRASRVSVWLDENAIASGDSLIGTIAMALAESDCVIAVLSPDAVASSWVQKELHIALTREVKGQSMKVIPLLYRECDMPVYLIDKAYADFRDGGRYRENLTGLLGALGVRDAAPRTHQDTDYRVQSALVSAEMLLHEMAGAPPDPRNLERLAALVTRARILAGQRSAIDSIVEDHRQPALHLADVDLMQLIHDIVRSFRPFARARRLSLSFTTTGEPFHMQTDRALVELILYQLLDNAVKYSYEHTTVFVRTSRTRSGMRISVSNEGVRFPPDETRRLIFERGYRGSDAMAVTESGAGIGLFLANKAAEALGGRLTIRPGGDVTEVAVEL